MPRESEKRYRRLLEEVRDGVRGLDVRPGETLLERLPLRDARSFTLATHPTFKGFTEIVHSEDR